MLHNKGVIWLHLLNVSVERSIDDLRVKSKDFFPLQLTNFDERFVDFVLHVDHRFKQCFHPHIKIFQKSIDLLSGWLFRVGEPFEKVFCVFAHETLRIGFVVNLRDSTEIFVFESSQMILAGKVSIASEELIQKFVFNLVDLSKKIFLPACSLDQNRSDGFYLDVQTH